MMNELVDMFRNCKDNSDIIDAILHTYLITKFNPDVRDEFDYILSYHIKSENKIIG